MLKLLRISKVIPRFAPIKLKHVDMLSIVILIMFLLGIGSVVVSAIIGVLRTQAPVVPEKGRWENFLVRAGIVLVVVSISLIVVANFLGWERSY